MVGNYFFWGIADKLKIRTFAPRTIERRKKAEHYSKSLIIEAINFFLRLVGKLKIKSDLCTPIERDSKKGVIY
jgi:hypothetical protein